MYYIQFIFMLFHIFSCNSLSTWHIYTHIHTPCILTRLTIPRIIVYVSASKTCTHEREIKIYLVIPQGKLGANERCFSVYIRNYKWHNK